MEIFKAWKFSMVFFLGLIFGPGIFWGLLEALGIFWGFDFCPHSIIPVTWNPEYPPWAGTGPTDSKLDLQIRSFGSVWIDFELVPEQSCVNRRPFQSKNWTGSIWNRSRVNIDSVLKHCMFVVSVPMGTCYLTFLGKMKILQLGHIGFPKGKMKLPVMY